MDEFKLSAFAVYPDGRSAEAFAEISEHSLPRCFEVMAGEVADWLRLALGADAAAAPPRAIELTLDWSGAPASVPAPERPVPPGDGTRCRPHPRSRSLRCAVRDIGCGEPAGRPIGTGLVNR